MKFSLKQRFLTFITTFAVVFATASAFLAFGGTGFSSTASEASVEDIKRELGVVKGVRSVPIFSSDYVMSDYTFRSDRAFPTIQSVQNYLDSVNSPLSDYVDGGQSSAYWIYNSARGVTSSAKGISPNINPGVMIAYLEKEQSLISLSNYDTEKDPQNRIRSAMGYGCPDGGSCADKYFGLANQLNNAAWQLEYNFNLSETGGSTPYKKGSTITTLDGFNVTISNSATAANYRYTPHGYWGNYNMWKILTANGWGVSSNSYTYSELDASNPRLTPNSQGSNSVTVDESQVEAFFRTPPEIGKSGTDITLLQQFLKQEGHFTYPYITGYYGTVTESALNAYLAANASSGVSCSDLTSKTWSIGQSGDEVRALQECLTDSGHFTYYLGATGYYGSVTKSSLDAFRGGSSSGNCQALKNETWSIGEVGEGVRKLQNCLQAEGYFNYADGATGYFGPVTSAALASSKSGVNCDALYTSARSWSIGRTGGDVTDLQQCLQAEGKYDWPAGVTGYYGSYTKSVL